ncbi:MAG: hypothetical protein ACYCZA_01005 [Thiobacillus sp.]
MVKAVYQGPVCGVWLTRVAQYANGGLANDRTADPASLTGRSKYRNKLTRCPVSFSRARQKSGGFHVLC